MSGSSVERERDPVPLRAVSRIMVIPFSSASRRRTSSSSSSIRPASIFDRSRMSLISESRCSPDVEDVVDVVVCWRSLSVAEHLLPAAPRRSR